MCQFNSLWNKVNKLFKQDTVHLCSAGAGVQVENLHTGRSFTENKVPDAV